MDIVEILNSFTILERCLLVFTSWGLAIISCYARPRLLILLSFPAVDYHKYLQSANGHGAGWVNRYGGGGVAWVNR